MVPEPQHVPAGFLQYLCPRSVHCRPFGVLPTIKFQRKHLFHACEIQDVAFGTMLSTKPDPELLIAQPRPEPGFSIGRLRTKAPRLIHG